MYSGILDSIGSIISNFGISTETATAVAIAYAEPSMQNINAVQQAFADAGTTPPPQLMQALMEKYYDSIRSYPLAYSGNLTNYLLIGAAVVATLFIFGKGKK